METKLYASEKEVLEQLYDWSKNFEAGANPWCLFLDICGYSQWYYGDAIAADVVDNSYMGYKELTLMAEALALFNNAGYDVIYELINEIHSKEENNE